MVAVGSIFDLRGPEFLRLYIFLLCGATLVAIVLRWMMRAPGAAGSALSFARGLDRYEIAYLTGGLATASAAALATLLHRGIVKIKTGRLSVDCSAGDSVLRELHPLETAIYAALADNEFVAPRALRSRASEVFRSSRLEARELVLPAGRVATIRFLCALPLLIVLTLGFMKISIGLSRNRPVGFLVMLSIATFIVALIALCKRLTRTRRGDAVLSAMRAEHAALRSTASSRPRQLELEDLTMACALFGPAIFASAGDTEYRDLARRFVPTMQGGDGSVAAGCGSSSGGGGCGGGCGGGGCGGCGGGS